MSFDAYAPPELSPILGPTIAKVLAGLKTRSISPNIAGVLNATETSPPQYERSLSFLHMMVRQGQAKTVRQLLAHGADPTTGPTQPANLIAVAVYGLNQTLKGFARMSGGSLHGDSSHWPPALKKAQEHVIDMIETLYAHGVRCDPSSLLEAKNSEHWNDHLPDECQDPYEALLSVTFPAKNVLIPAIATCLANHGASPARVLQKIHNDQTSCWQGVGMPHRQALLEKCKVLCDRHDLAQVIPDKIFSSSPRKM